MERIHAAPVIETPRLILRGYVIGDFPHVAASWADPEVLRNIALWPMLGYGYWAATERSTGRYVGDVGFADFKREIEPSLKGAPEIGWVLASWAHGVGYATEAAQAAIAWLERTLGPQRTVCIIDAGNRASVRVAEKLGFREFARCEYKSAQIVMFERGGASG
jgi:RimJ/RimL family protein N-acetyltransferase